MTTNELRERVYCLSERLSWLGISADIAALSVVELWGLLAFLQRVAGGSDGAQ